MISILVTEDDGYYNLEITGHTDPLICSSVSTLRLLLEGYLGWNGASKEGESFLSVSKEDEYGVFLLSEMCNMFDDLMFTYPDNICFEFRGETYGENKHYS